MGECHRNKRKSSSASVFFGDYREKWEDMSEHSAITPCANHLTSQQFPCSDASWLQHSPRPSSGGAFAQMMDLYVIKPLKTSKKLWPCIENSLDPAQLSSHCCSEMLKYSPSFVAAPAAGRRSLTLGCIWPVPQSCWQWILFFLLWVLFCFVFFLLVLQFPHITTTGTAFAAKGTVLHNFGGRMWRRGSCLENLAASRKNKNLNGHHSLGG